MYLGKFRTALVYDSDVSSTDSPLNGNLMGSNLGIVAFDVIDVFKRTDGSTGSLPRVVIRIRDVTEVAARPLVLFSNAPEPASSSEPYDVSPPNSPPAISISPAN